MSSAALPMDNNRYRDPYRDDRKKIAPSMRNTFTVAQMNERHHEIARRLVLGQKVKEIAEDLGISTMTVRNVRNSPIVQEQISILRGARDSETRDIAKQIQELAPKCLQVLEEQLNDDEVSPHLKSKNAFGLLGIAGHAPIRNVNVKSVQAILTGEDIERIRDKSIQAGMKSGVVIDA